MPTFENISLEGGLSFEVEPVPLGGSIERPIPFTGTFSYSTQGANGPFTLGEGDFTIEWFSYLPDPNQGGIFYNLFYCEIFPGPTSTQGIIQVRYDGTGAVYFNLTIPDAWNVWDHYAITRTDTVMRLFRNGQQLGSNVTVTTFLNSATNQFILSGGSTRGRVGKITNFNYVVGTSLYSSNFTPPTSPILPVSGCQLLLRATSASTFTTDSSGTGKVPSSSTGINFSSETPFTS